VTIAVIADLRRGFGLRSLEPETEMTMTDDRMALLELVEKHADGDLVREMLAFAAERIMDAEIEARTGAAKGARTPMREVQRNGYRDRDWDTRAGRIALEIPKLRKGAISPASWNLAARPRRLWWPSSRRPSSTASRRDQSTIWSRRWGEEDQETVRRTVSPTNAACPRAGSAASAPSSHCPPLVRGQWRGTNG
jgi:hypothetical protein